MGISAILVWLDLMSELLLAVPLQRSTMYASPLKWYYVRLAGEAEERRPERSGPPNRAAFARLGVIQRWVVSTQVPSAVGTAEQDSCAVPSGLGLVDNAFPALKRWAKLFRACGARLGAVQRFFLTATGFRKDAIKRPAALGSGMQSRRPPFFTFMQRTPNPALAKQ